MISLIHWIYKAFTTYNMENAFTISYENLIIRTMNQINESEKEECKSIVRTVFFIYCIPYLLLISEINRKFHVDFSIPGSIVFSFLIAMYGFLSSYCDQMYQNDFGRSNGRNYFGLDRCFKV